MSAARLRIGWPALAIDAGLAVAAMLLSYRVRFDGAEAARFLSAGAVPLASILLLQLAVASMTGLYRASGQMMWPIRLAIGCVGGALVGFGVAYAGGIETGLSRQALTSQVALLGFAGAVWRSVIGLRVRQQRRAALAREFGGQDLVELGSDVGSMAGGVARSWAYRHLLANIVTKDLKLKYQRSVLGFAWSLLNPLLMIGVYTVAFTYVMRLRTPNFVLYILIGLLAWNFFAGAVMSATDAVVGNASLLRSVVFPRVVLPFASVAFNLIQYLLTLTVFLPIMLLVYQVPLEPRMLLFPVFLLLQVLFTSGITLLLATASSMFRDVKHLVDVGIGVFFWATPIIYEPRMIPEPFQQVALLSPMASFIRAYQDLFYYRVVPELPVWIVAAVYGVAMFVCGLSVFLAYEDRFPELV